jgi:hypothetical protein
VVGSALGIFCIQNSVIVRPLGAGPILSIRTCLYGGTLQHIQHIGGVDNGVFVCVWCVCVCVCVCVGVGVGGLGWG